MRAAMLTISRAGDMGIGGEQPIKVAAKVIPSADLPPTDSVPQSARLFPRLPRHAISTCTMVWRSQAEIYCLNVSKGLETYTARREAFQGAAGAAWCGFREACRIPFPPPPSSARLQEPLSSSLRVNLIRASLFPPGSQTPDQS